MERTIPIFEALVKSDEGREFHMNFGQLGFALKDKREPDWKGAEIALTNAIGIRGSWRQNNFAMYEFNRALCLIELEKKEGSTESSRLSILNDLRAVFANEQLTKIAETKDENEKTPILERMNTYKIAAKDFKQ
jgi:hypothetical protein